MVIDSHILLWWLEAPALLSREASFRMQSLDRDDAVVFVSAVTFWELRLKEAKGRLEPKLPVNRWPQLLAKHPQLRILGVGVEEYLLAAELDWDHRDPADRIIAATALRRGVPVITKDRVFHQRGCPVEAVW